MHSWLAEGPQKPNLRIWLWCRHNEKFTVSKPVAPAVLLPAQRPRLALFHKSSLSARRHP